MSYLLDTNVVSETIRRNPNKTVTSWLDQIPGEALFISVLTLGEIRKGIEALPDRKRRERLRLWIDHELPRWFEERVLPVDLAVADRWGRLLAEVRRPVPTIDSLLAATALHHDLRLVTHNARDFDYPGLEVINPWLL
ncbi:MAG: type II toxin-antitoxin system VapC family toxin [Candidatus Tectomicrobia bacterium]|uniref:Ribonuclease VapC n=1 Tax=Tectimicrobiota bacterium TaxID=2528274 RepID=A0A932GMX9_UNCTE|nr:type II toxin-antitoxin system VapC family toxin [Candidatus Tectomicrobia bacterium]